MSKLTYQYASPSIDVKKRSRVRQIYAMIKAITFMDSVCFVLPLFAIFLWSISLKAVNINAVTDLGMISVFSPALIAALGIMTISFCITLQRPQMRVPLLLIHFALIIFMLYGINTLVEEAPRFNVVYRHAGYTEFIMRTGTVDPNLDAYFNWPAFFSFSAFLTQIAGYHNILAFAIWSPVYFNIFYLCPMYLIFSTFTTDKRIIWLSLWIFCLTNWIGQDYYSPQGLNFFFYLLIIAILLKWFKMPSTHTVKPLGKPFSRILFLPRIYAWATAPDPLVTSSSQRKQRIALIICIIILFAFVVSSHPLTPFFILMSVSLLIILRRCTLWWLPILMGTMTLAWILIMTRAYLAGHMSDVLGGFTNIGSTFTANVSDRVVGSPEHALIAQIRILMTAGVWLLALLGGVWRLRAGHHDSTVVLLAIAPFPLFVIQPYGGEMLLRVYLFSLPSMTFFMASFFYTSVDAGRTHQDTLAMAILTTLLLSGFLFARYGNERQDYMTNNEIAGVQRLYNIAPPGSLLVATWDGAPWKFQGFEEYTYVTLSDDVSMEDAIVHPNIFALTHFIELQKATPTAKSYLLFTRSEFATYDMSSGLKAGQLKQLEKMISNSPDFQLIYSNPDAQIFEFIDPTSAGDAQ